MVRIVQTVVCLSLASFLASCSGDRSAPAKKRFELKVVDERQQSAYPYTLSGPKQKLLLDRLKKLTPHENYDDVIRLLGEPDKAMPAFSKTYIGADWKGADVFYYLRKQGHLGGNMKFDRHVYLRFDNDGKLESIVFQNLRGIASEIKGIRVYECIFDNASSSTKTTLFEPGKKPVEIPEERR
jgi:hypothetical protein